MIEQVQTTEAAPPGGHYSQATAYGDLIFVSGQLPVRADGQHNSTLLFVDQARIALKNVFEIISAAGSGPERVVKVTAYIVGIENWSAFNEVYAEFFGAAKPARAIVPVPTLHHGYLLEIEAIAAR